MLVSWTAAVVRLLQLLVGTDLYTAGESRGSLTMALRRQLLLHLQLGGVAPVGTAQTLPLPRSSRGPGRG